MFLRWSSKHCCWLCLSGACMATSIFRIHSLLQFCCRFFSCTHFTLNTQMALNACFQRSSSLYLLQCAAASVEKPFIAVMSLISGLEVYMDDTRCENRVDSSGIPVSANGCSPKLLCFSPTITSSWMGFSGSQHALPFSGRLEVV